MGVDWDEPRGGAGAAVTVGEDLARHSVAELQERVRVLKAEIERVEAEIARKGGSRTAAENVFSRPGER